MWTPGIPNPFGSVPNDEVHPPEPTMGTRSVHPAAAPRQNNAIPRISGVPNDPSSKKKRVIRKPVSKPRRPNNAVQARAPAPNPPLQITPETLGLKATTDMGFHPADPAPITQTGTTDRTYIQL
ncbi:hypothetical protein CAEBREN_04229 [Caenorhabditis brenneri]|uniref:Uncharacterized protein n=1 Tax=Caenorhabditis brenneri TaxID=135651 RepID=G0MXC3_CAEBE|nr:hypothetical protein CAEBREN_04229 [Caenorhabditis brenneri]